MFLYTNIRLTDSILTLLAAMNASDLGSLTSHPVRILSATLAGCLAVYIIIGNMLVIIAVRKYKPLREQPQNVLIVSLAIPDILIGLCVLPLKITQMIFDRWTLGPVLCRWHLSSSVFLGSASVMILCAIALDRYMAICHTLFYAPRRNTATMIKFALISYLVGIIVVFPALCGFATPKLGSSNWSKNKHICRLNDQPWYAIYATTLVFIIPTMFLTVVYSRLFRIARLMLRSHASRGSSFKTCHRETVVHASKIAHNGNSCYDAINLNNCSTLNHIGSVQVFENDQNLCANHSRYQSAHENQNEDDVVTKEESISPMCWSLSRDIFKNNVRRSVVSGRCDNING